MHDEDEMHEHDVMELLEGDDVEEIEGIEKFTLRSVGIDIGSSTTHTIFSRLVLRREGAGLSSKFVVASRDILYRSPIMLTPYLGGTLIDVDKVTSFINESYASAGFTPDDIDTGAVVITGEALKKENSQPIIEHFSEESGRFICATAGPMHEALLAAHGSGAVGMSKHHSNAVLDIDMGGGTTKVSLIQGGEVVQMIAVEIGARLIAYDGDMTITRVEQPAHTIMKALGDSVEVGGKLTTKQAEAFSEKMTDILFDVVSGGKLDPLSASLMLTDPLHYDSLDAIDHVVFSGGVSEYIYERTTESYGDVGPIFGAIVRKRAEATLKKGVLVASAEGIRATVIGAGEYTLQASGSTSYISTADVLPVHGIQVARALIDKEQSDEEVRQAILAALGKYDVASIAVRRALSVTPDLINRPLDVRSMYPDADVYESHLAALKKHVEANPEDRGARFLLGFIHYGSARPEAALALFKQLADADPEDELAAAMRDSAARVIPPDGSASQP